MIKPANIAEAVKPEIATDVWNLNDYIIQAEREREIAKHAEAIRNSNPDYRPNYQVYNKEAQVRGKLLDFSYGISILETIGTLIFLPATVLVGEYHVLSVKLADEKDPAPATVFTKLDQAKSLIGNLISLGSLNRDFFREREEYYKKSLKEYLKKDSITIVASASNGRYFFHGAVPDSTAQTKAA